MRALRARPKIPDVGRIEAIERAVKSRPCVGSVEDIPVRVGRYRKPVHGQDIERREGAIHLTERRVLPTDCGDIVIADRAEPPDKARFDESVVLERFRSQHM